MDERLGLTGAVLVEVQDGQALPEHPDVVAVRWLSAQPAVAHLTLRSGADDLAVSQTLHDQESILWAHPDFWLPVSPFNLPDDPLVAEQWHLENTGQTGTPGADVNAAAAWSWSTGAGEVIAIIDSGVDAEHPDLDAVSGYDYVDGDEDSYPESGNAHGTACAGLAAGIGNNGIGVAGVAYDASVYGIRLLGDGTTSSDTYSAIREAVDAGASVLSNSWGYSGACEGYTLLAGLRRALEHAEEEGRGGLGAVVVFAAGNENCDVSDNELLTHETVVAVAATSRYDVRESYSSYGTPIDISAPSGGLLTTDITGDSGYGDHNGDVDYHGGMSGTSASTPLVSGVFALMFAANPRLTAADARDVVCQTATRNDIQGGAFDSTGWSPYYGCGRIDAGAAVEAVANAAPEAPVPDMVEVALQYVDRVWLDWLPAADPDGDVLRYRVQWWVEDGEPVVVDVDGLALSLTGQVNADEVVSWQVQATDMWGEGPWSEVVTFTVSDRPEPAPVPEEPAGGCQTVVGGAWGLAALLAACRRRKQGAAQPARSR